MLLKFCLLFHIKYLYNTNNTYRHTQNHNVVKEKLLEVMKRANRKVFQKFPIIIEGDVHGPLKTNSMMMILLTEAMINIQLQAEKNLPHALHHPMLRFQKAIL